MKTIPVLLLYSSISGSAIIIGSYIGTRQIPEKIVAFVLTFGSGVLLSVISFSLMHEAYKNSGPIFTSISFLIGGIFFYLVETYLEKKVSGGMGIILGTALDDIPETLSMGIGFASGENLGIILALSMFLHNIPEGISSIKELLDNGSLTKNQALALAVILGICAPLWAMVGYLFLKNIKEVWIGVIMAFSSGAILFMTGTDMIPKAHKIGTRIINIGLLLGFLAAFLLTKIFRV